GNIILSHAGNDFVGTVDLRGGAVEIADANTLALGTIEANHLYVRAATIDLANDVSTSGDQEYHGALELGADVALDSGGEVTFGGTVDGAHRLSVQAAGAVGFGGAVGAATALTALDVDAGSFNASRIEVSGDLSVVASSGDISQSGAFRVGGDARFDAGSGNIVLANAGNDFIGTVSLAGGAATIVDANALTLDAFDVATLSATSHGALQLGQGAVAGAAIVIRDASALSLSVVRATRGSDVEVAAGGALTVPAGEIDVGTGSLRLAAGSGTLGTRGRLAGGDVHLSGADGILL